MEEGPGLRLPERGIHQLFELQADRTPDEPALFSPEGEVSYRALERRANRLANHLLSLGVGPEARAALCLERSASAVTAMLAVLKAGGAFVALDPSSPPEWRAAVLGGSGAQFLITCESLEDLEEPAGPVRVHIDRDALVLAQSSACRPDVPVQAGSLAYVLYATRDPGGAAGEPRGVATPHRAALQRLAWMWDRFPFDLGEGACQRTSFDDVGSIWEVFGPLLQGVPSVVIPDDAARDPERLLVALAANGVSRILLPPAQLRALLDLAPDLGARLPRLRCWMCGGEPLPADLAARFQRALPAAVLLHLYGAAEVAGDVTWHKVEPGRREGLPCVPLGRPLANTRVAVVDVELRPVPPGEAGEVLAAGEGVARGYLGRPDLTAERFVPDPFAEVPGARACRLGDRARWLPDGGGLEYLGRLRP
ncbi:MAG TPA: amino acid adenylation domain-containing protein [Thermoanaerobaculia bacterium]|nr:amino acid adenylation domain-containing protein [Thermoanaerobaculia bacterium]